MQRSRKKFPLELKQKVLEESVVYGRTLSSIAEEYGVPEYTIRRWRRERKKLSAGLNHVHEASKFVEVSLEEAASQVVLEIASLTFKGISLTLEGKIKSSSLIEIIKVMEKAC